MTTTPSLPATAATRRLRRLGLVLIGLTAAALVGSLMLLAAGAGRGSAGFRHEMLAQDVMVVALGVPGAWLLIKVPRHPAGWLMTSAATALVLNSVGGAWAVFATTGGRDLPFAASGLVLLRLAALSNAGVPLLLLVFPDGRLPSRRWRPVLGLTLAGCGLLALVALLVPLSYVFADTVPGEVPASLRSVPDLTGLTRVPSAWWDALSTAVIVLDLAVLVLALASLVVRYRRADATQTAQLRWLAVGGLAVVVGSAVARLTPAVVGKPLLALATLVLAGTVVVAVLRYRLGDAALALNRSVVYLLLTGVVVAIYGAVVATVTVLLGRGVAPWFAAAAVAVAFAPLRSRLQRLVDRWLRGERNDPYGVVSTLSRQLESSHDPQEVLSATVDTLAGAFRASWVRIELTGEEVLVAERGTPAPAAIEIPLVTAGERFGTLRLALPPGVRLADRDRLLIADLVRHSRAVVQAVETSASLRQARSRLVVAREEERRLRRDLHDGLGPQLAALTLKLDAVRNLLRQDPDRAAEVARDAKGDVADAVADVRRLVHDLRPPALDEVGLLGAVRQQVAKFSRLSGADASGTELDIVLTAPASLGELPAAVEVAAYRITSEALTNVARHARATRCEVRLGRPDAQHLGIDVCDDGVGLPAARRDGVGLASMRERAAEVGGHCEVRPGEPRGTVVSARLPVGAS